MIVGLGAIAFVDANSLRATKRNELVVPVRGSGPALSDVRVSEDVVGTRLKRVIVRLVARRSRVERELTEPATGLLGQARIQTATAQRRRTRVKAPGEESATAGAAIRALEVARTGLLPEQHLARVAQDVCQRHLHAPVVLAIRARPKQIMP